MQAAFGLVATVRRARVLVVAVHRLADARADICTLVARCAFIAVVARRANLTVIGNDTFVNRRAVDISLALTFNGPVTLAVDGNNPIHAVATIFDNITTRRLLNCRSGLCVCCARRGIATRRCDHVARTTEERNEDGRHGRRKDLVHGRSPFLRAEMAH